MYSITYDDLALSGQDLKVFIPVVAGLIGFIIFWFSLQSEKLKTWFVRRFGADQGLANHVVYARILGAFTIGVMPAAIYLAAVQDTHLNRLGIGLLKEALSDTILWTVGLSGLLIAITAISARKPQNLSRYPQIRAKNWTPGIYMANLVSWAVYLIGYEFFFRGLLLFPLVEQMGLWPAIAVNIGLYSATHIPKGMNEAIGAIPLSVVLCLLTIHTGNIWIAVFVHIAMAWTNSLVSFRYHPDMSLIKYPKHV